MAKKAFEIIVETGETVGSQHFLIFLHFFNPTKLPPAESVGQDQTAQNMLYDL